MAGQNGPMVVNCNCATKSNPSEPPAKQPPAAGAGGDDGVKAAPPTNDPPPPRLSQEDIDWILSQTKQPDHRYHELGASPEEAAEEREFYRGLCESHDTHWEDFSRFQAWVRHEYAARGFVEVDQDFLDRRAGCVALVEEEWDKMFEGFSDADFGGEDDAEKTVLLE